MCLLVTFQFHDIVSTLQNFKGKGFVVHDLIDAKPLFNHLALSNSLEVLHFGCYTEVSRSEFKVFAKQNRIIVYAMSVLLLCYTGQ